MLCSQSGTGSVPETRPSCSPHALRTAALEIAAVASEWLTLVASDLRSERKRRKGQVRARYICSARRMHVLHTAPRPVARTQALSADAELPVLGLDLVEEHERSVSELLTKLEELQVRSNAAAKAPAVSSGSAGRMTSRLGITRKPETVSTG